MFFSFRTNVVMNYTEVESKVREATNDDQWGPHGTAMAEIAKYTYTYEHFPEVMGMIWKRMLHEKKNWRRVYKVKNICMIGDSQIMCTVHQNYLSRSTFRGHAFF